MRRPTNRLFVLASAVALLAAGAAPNPPAPPAVRPVTETHFGVTVTDPYRYFEDPKDPGLATYFKTQSAYTRAVLDALPGRTALAKRIAELDNATESVSDVQPVGGTYFYQKRPAGANTTRLYARGVSGGSERLVFDPDRFAKSKSEHYTIDYYSPSPNARYVAVGLSEGGSEKTFMRVIDARSGQLLSDAIDRAIYVAPSWRDDGRSFYYFRTPKARPNAPQSERDTKGVARLHVLGRNPDADPAIFGYGLTPRIPLAPEDVGIVTVSPRSRWAVAVVAHGVQNEIQLYAAPAAAATSARTPWRKLADYRDNVLGATAVADTLYVSSHKNAARHRILALDLRNGSLASARVVVPESERVIEDISLAGDGFYLRDLEGGLSKLRKLAVAANGAPGTVSEVTLPYTGAVGAVATDPMIGGASFVEASWTQSARWFRTSPSGTVFDTGLRKQNDPDYSGITSQEVLATSADGTQVPLSIVLQKNAALDGSHPTVVDGYGAYGIVIRPSFSATRLAWLERGGIYAECHPRGGGEYGEDWHFGAHIATKQRTIDDFIGCARYLIDHKYTQPAKLAGQGTSAGGVTIGNAIVQHPELFAAALDVVGDTNAVRDEFAEGGPANIPEFGTITNKTGWDALYATDAYLHVKDHTPYPAVLAVTGANDPRVAPWIVGKFAARLQAATSSGKPVLLRVDYDAGHGFLGSSRVQGQQLATDEYSFLLWQLGDPAFATATRAAPPASP
ncbi:MAG TPA: prolyl oligopeptidase family serine peptidase [Candidatus Elarobacter sp.]|jgi:prolyl oligopeptidase|nr:prolyl oligopeptidase family serine peptidase [Candidatus Elarobacter sp.]